VRNIRTFLSSAGAVLEKAERKRAAS